MIDAMAVKWTVWTVSEWNKTDDRNEHEYNRKVIAKTYYNFLNGGQSAGASVSVNINLFFSAKTKNTSRIH